MSVKSFLGMSATETGTCTVVFTEMAHAQRIVTFSNSVDSAGVVRRIGSATDGPTERRDSVGLGGVMASRRRA